MARRENESLSRRVLFFRNILIWHQINFTPARGLSSEKGTEIRALSAYLRKNLYGSS